MVCDTRESTACRDSSRQKKEMLSSARRERHCSTKPSVKSCPSSRSGVKEGWTQARHLQLLQELLRMVWAKWLLRSGVMCINTHLQSPK